MPPEAQSLLANRNAVAGGGVPVDVKRSYDLVVIGGGAGGLVAAREARRRGATTVIVQDGRVGGECTFTGCVPSKALLAAAASGAIDNAEFREEQVQSIPLSRAAEPDEIGRPAVSSPPTAPATGATYVMDGGLMQMVGWIRHDVSDINPSTTSTRSAPCTSGASNTAA